MYKFLRTGLVSHADVSMVWKKGEWREVQGPLVMCRHGFHASPTFLQALSYVKGEIFALVEGGEEKLQEEDKECYRKMRLLVAYEWTREDSLALAMYSAELVLPIFEKNFPNDPRPRQAIEAVRKSLEIGAAGAEMAAWAARTAAWAVATVEAAGAAEAAGAIEAAWSAAAAARAVGAAWAAGAVEAAAEAAVSAEAAWAAGADITRQINEWALARIKEKQPILFDVE